jgi:lipopolysaccharide/colanic/teichoic acid biosynthesis glycosyltransferase
MVRFDIEYAEGASLLLDLRILARTLPVVLGRQGVA